MSREEQSRRVSQIIEGLELVSHTERDQNGGVTIYFDDVEHGEEVRNLNWEVGKILERANFYGMVVTDINFVWDTLRLQHRDRVEWSDQ